MKELLEKLLAEMNKETEPDTTEPDTSEPDTTEPVTTEPDTTESDTTDNSSIIGKVEELKKLVETNNLNIELLAKTIQNFLLSKKVDTVEDEADLISEKDREFYDRNI